MNFIKKHNYTIQLLLLVIGLASIAGYSVYYFYPDYTLAMETSITLDTVSKGIIVIGNVYFLISLPLFFLVFSNLKKMKNPSSKRQTDYLVFMTKLVIYGVWLYISYYTVTNDNYTDDISKIMVLGVFGITVVSFDLIYLLLSSFILSINGVSHKIKDIRDIRKNSNISQNEAI